ncbi:MAG: FkbM family methyltransferase [Dehalococcoidia bacterium]|nr:FkbM family methyltransferase [Dehalococcoidia bacterium]MDD5493131.1 FkbM family methyltransferase [Dehalococcoidia bacterium]
MLQKLAPKSKGSLPAGILRIVIKPFIGTGIGRFSLVNKIYQFFAKVFIIPQENQLVTINGYKMYINLDREKGLDGISQELIFHGTYEKYATSLFQQYVKRGMTVITIGANIGYFVLLFSSLVGKDGKVFAFEPAPQNFNLLVRNIELNGYDNIVALQKAVSDRSGAGILYIDKSDPAGHSLFQEATNQVTGGKAETLSVDMVSLDEYFKNNNISADIIQMDIQGAEPLAVKGMENLISSSKEVKIFTEFWPFGLEKSGFSAEQYWTQLNQLGFKYIYLINERHQNLEPTSLVEAVKLCRGNVITPPSAVNLLCTATPLDCI